MRPSWDVLGQANMDPANNATRKLYDVTKDWTQFEDVAAQ
jgi:hypothetical protein